MVFAYFLYFTAGLRDLLPMHLLFRMFHILFHNVFHQWVHWQLFHSKLKLLLLLVRNMHAVVYHWALSGMLILSWLSSIRMSLQRKTLPYKNNREHLERRNIYQKEWMAKRKLKHSFRGGSILTGELDYGSRVKQRIRGYGLLDCSRSKRTPKQVLSFRTAVREATSGWVNKPGPGAGWAGPLSSVADILCGETFHATAIGKFIASGNLLRSNSGSTYEIDLDLCFPPASLFLRGSFFLNVLNYTENRLRNSIPTIA